MDPIAVTKDMNFGELHVCDQDRRQYTHHRDGLRPARSSCSGVSAGTYPEESKFVAALNGAVSSSGRQKKIPTLEAQVGLWADAAHMIAFAIGGAPLLP